MESKKTERTKLEQYFVDNLDKALELGWIKPYHQPLIRAASGMVSDEEAFARWEDPEKGIFQAADFVPVLEEEGLTYKLDLYMVEKVLEKMQGQRDHGLFVVPESINIGRSDFDACDIVEEIAKRIDESGFSRDKLSVELSERVIASDLEFMKKQVERFRKAGIRVWMDNYGSGYASMLILLNIKFDLLKVDGIFIDQLHKNEKGQIITTELIKTAVSLGMDTVAECVENQEQASFLKEIGCAKLQGYYYIQPVSLEDIIKRNEQHKQIGFENPDEAEYYETLGRLNLYDLSISRNDEKGLGNYFDTMPMVVFAVDETKVSFIRANKSFREFIAKNYPKYTNTREVPYDLIHQGPGYYSFNSVRQCAKDGKRKIIEDRTSDGRIMQMFLRRVAVNPITNTAAVAIAVLSVSESVSEEGLNYNYIARALSEDYITLYFVDLNTDEFTEYTSDGVHRDISINSQGTGFFDLDTQGIGPVLYAEDVELFKKNFTKKNIENQIRKNGVFSYLTRIMIDGKPAYVNVKAVKIRGNGNYIIVGVNNVDDQMKDRETLERAKEERLVYSKISALTGNFIYIYTIDLDTDHYNRYNPANVVSGMAFAEEGDDFFNQVLERAPKGIYKDDVDSFLSVFTREKILKKIRLAGMFEHEHRLIVEGKPRYVSLRATLMEEDGKTKLIMGILDIDDQIRREKEYAMNLNAAEIKANLDELTGVKNKHAYAEAERRMDEFIAENPDVEFALVVFDLNGLKQINDTKGHQAGDRYIIKGCNTICRFFKHSPVFRVGGDEFVAFVQGYDYLNIDVIMSKFKKHNLRNQLKGDVVVAAGMSRYNNDGKVAPVFERADAEMYKNKKELK